MDRRAALSDYLKRFDRIAMVGGPDTGKSTLSEAVTDRFVLHTDDFLDLEWADVPGAIIEGLAGHERFVVEGVQVARALRRGLQVDAVIYLDESFGRIARSPMAKAVNTVFAEWRLQHRSVPVISPDLLP